MCEPAALTGEVVCLSALPLHLTPWRGIPQVARRTGTRQVE
ncbi:hypothetical protein OG352_04360 [Streptomyces sp. NBC_01485]|nr:hypothetical protein [Streptomyces sp. NBC_01485]